MQCALQRGGFSWGSCKRRQSSRASAHGTASDQALNGLLADAFLQRLTRGEVLPSLFLRALRNFLKKAFRQNPLGRSAGNVAGDSRLRPHGVQSHRGFGVFQTGDLPYPSRDGAGKDPCGHLQQVVSRGGVRLLFAHLLRVLAHRQDTFPDRADLPGEVGDPFVSLRLRDRARLHRRINLGKVARQHLFGALGDGLHPAVVLGDGSNSGSRVLGNPLQRPERTGADLTLPVSALCLGLLFRIDRGLMCRGLGRLHLRRVHALDLGLPLRRTKGGRDPSSVCHVASVVDRIANLSSGDDVTQADASVDQAGNTADQADGNVGELSNDATFRWRRRNQVVKCARRLLLPRNQIVERTHGSVREDFVDTMLP